MEKYGAKKGRKTSPILTLTDYLTSGEEVRTSATVLIEVGKAELESAPSIPRYDTLLELFPHKLMGGLINPLSANLPLIFLLTRTKNHHAGHLE